MSSDLVLFEKKEGIATLRLNRVDKKNALNGEMIDALEHYTHEIKKDDSIDIAILKGKGDTFCTGADLKWFSEAGEMEELKRMDRIKAFPRFLKCWHQLPQTTITTGHGFLYGGALGLLAISDFVLLSQNSRLRLSEVVLGLLPASIAPYLIHRMGISRAKSLMLSADAFTADQAFTYGLSDYVVPFEQLQVTEDQLVDKLRLSPGDTRKSLKRYLHGLEEVGFTDEMIEYSATALSDALATENAQQFIQAMFKGK
jgi:methylglutaconyl-CoA hydratase